MLWAVCFISSRRWQFARAVYFDSAMLQLTLTSTLARPLTILILQFTLAPLLHSLFGRFTLVASVGSLVWLCALTVCCSPLSLQFVLAAALGASMTSQTSPPLSLVQT